jgi:hypothetical protein
MISQIYYWFGKEYLSFLSNSTTDLLYFLSIYSKTRIPAPCQMYKELAIPNNMKEQIYLNFCFFTNKKF